MFPTFLSKLVGLTNVHMIFSNKSSSCLTEQGTMIVESPRNYFRHTVWGLVANYYNFSPAVFISKVRCSDELFKEK